jgi:hypothetical protein
MTEMWVDIVEALTEDVELKALPHHLQQLFVNVDPEPTFCAGISYGNRIANRNQPKER